MSALMELEITNADGSKETHTVKPVTQVAFERQYGVGLATIGQNGRMEYLYWLAWHAAKIDGKELPSFDAWTQTIQGVSSAEEDASPLVPSTSEVPQA